MKEFELELRPERHADSHEVLSENLLGPPLGRACIYISVRRFG